MDDLKRYSAQILAGLQGGANTNAGVSDPVVNDFAKAGFLNVFNREGAGQAQLANEAATQEREAAERARQEQINKLKDKLDPNKYRAEKDRKDGGYSFYDPEGNQIGIDRYAQVTGRNAADILSDSDNPFDLQYVNDYKNTRGLIQAIQEGDVDTINEYQASNGDISQMKPEDLMRELIRKYPHIYGNGQYNDSYKNNNNPLLRLNTGMGTATSSASGGSGGGTRNWNS